MKMKKLIYLLALVLFVSCSGNKVVNSVTKVIGEPSSTVKTPKGGGQYVWNHFDVAKFEIIKKNIDDAIGCLPIEENVKALEYKYYQWETSNEKVYLEFNQRKVSTDNVNNSIQLTIIRK